MIRDILSRRDKLQPLIIEPEAYVRQKQTGKILYGEIENGIALWEAE